MVVGDLNVLVSLRFFDDRSMAILREAGCRVTVVEPPLAANDGVFSEAELISMLDGKQGWIVGHAKVTRRVLEISPQLAVIARRGVGHERIDVAAARDLGKVVTIAAGGNAPSVADQAIGMMLGVGRRLHEQQMRMREGNWTILVGTELYQRTVGLVGFGRIAQQVARRLKGFEARVLVFTPRAYPSMEAEHGVTFVELPVLLSESDYISLHAPLTPQTRHLIDASALAAMKPTAVLINTARGGMVDEVALYAALRNGQLLGAAFDVFESEHDPAMRPQLDCLIQLPNFIATPHSAASTHEALERSNLIAANCVVSVLAGRRPADAYVVA